MAVPKIKQREPQEQAAGITGSCGEALQQIVCSLEMTGELFGRGDQGHGRTEKKYVPKRWESKGETYMDDCGRMRADTSANIYESMLTSDAFALLTTKQQILYVFCKAQYYGKRKPEKDFPEVEQMQGAELFYLNWAAVQQYRLYKPSMDKNFYQDMKALCDHGLIEKVASGKGRRQKSIYRFSDRWKTWQLPEG